MGDKFSLCKRGTLVRMTNPGLGRPCGGESVPANVNKLKIVSRQGTSALFAH